MASVFLLNSKEDWICDRFCYEWQTFHQASVQGNPYNADILWLLAGWCWNQLDHALLRSKRVILTQHHIVPEKFDRIAWDRRDVYVTEYHVPSEKTRDQISGLTSKPIHVIPFWVNSLIWEDLAARDKMTRSQFREKNCSKYGLSPDDFLIGSFQRDTEGSDCISPKLEKGPDILVDFIAKKAQELSTVGKNVHVVLGGWRRQYVIKRLEQLGISYTYNELASQPTLNVLYNLLDLYVVSARYEGGPQAIVECAVTRTPIVSTDVGLAPALLSKASIYSSLDDNPVPDVDYAFDAVQPLLMPDGFLPFEEMLK